MKQQPWQQAKLPSTLGVWLEMGRQLVLPISLFCSNICSLAADPGFLPQPWMEEPIHILYQVMENFSI